MIPKGNLERIVRERFHFAAGPGLRGRMWSHVRHIQEEAERTAAAHSEPLRRRSIMKNPLTHLATAAVVMVALILTVVAMREATPVASAADILYQAANAMNGLTSFHVRVEMRTLPSDNFAIIGLDYDFVPIDFWRQYANDNTPSQWRLEEPGRVVVMDGYQSTMLIKDNKHVFETQKLDPEAHWKECLVEVDKVISREAQKATVHATDFVMVREPGDDGREKIIISVEAQATVPETDYLYNQSIETSDHLKIYRFDAETTLLEDIEIYVHDGDRDVLVFRLVEADYNVDLDPALFQLELPEDAVYSTPLEVLPDNARYEAMSPKEAAVALFTACAEEDWDELLKFMGQTDIPDRVKIILGGLEILEIGEAFQSAGSANWFVPYKITLKTGQTRQHNLALRRDAATNRFQLNGGI